jgi:GAF domain-containing protein
MTILEQSATLQTDLIDRLRKGNCTRREMLQLISDKVSDVLKADACAIYIIEKQNSKAFQRAGTGYQRQFVDQAQCRVVPADQVAENPGAEKRLGLTSWILSTGKVLLARSPEEITQHPHHSGIFDQEMLNDKAKTVMTFLGVPYYMHGEIVGLIKVERCAVSSKGVKSFEVEDVILLETMARVTGKFLTYFEMVKKGHRHRENALVAWTRSVLSEVASAEGEIDSFLDIIVRVITPAMNVDSCALYLIDYSKKTLTQRAGTGALSPREIIRSYELPSKEEALSPTSFIITEKTLNRLEKKEKIPRNIILKLETLKDKKYREEKKFRNLLENEIGPLDPENVYRDKIVNLSNRKVGLTAWIAATGKPHSALNYQELRNHPHHRGEYDQYNFPSETNTECGAFLGFPLRFGNETLGVIKVENRSRKSEPDCRVFDEDSKRCFEIFSQDISVFIKYLQNQSHTGYQVISDAKTTIFEILQGGMDFRKLSNTVVEKTAKLFNARACALFIKEGDQLVQRAAYGWASKGPERKYQLLDPEIIKDNPAESEKVALTVWIACRQEKFIARSNLELVMHPHHKGTFDEYNFEKNQRCESFMGVPLLVEERTAAGGDTKKRLIGVLKVETKVKKVKEEEEYTYFSSQDELVFDLIANSVAIAIENARLLESQRLAENISGQTSKTLVTLHVFVKEHSHSENALKEVADSLRVKLPYIAAIVENYANLIQSERPDAVLNRIISDVEKQKEFVILEGVDPFLALYKSFSRAMKARTLPEIIRFSNSQAITQVQIKQDRLFLNEASSLWVEVVQNIASLLKGEGPEPREGKALAGLNAYLIDSLKKTDGIVQPEGKIIHQILNQWLNIIQSAHTAFQPVPNPYLSGGGPILPGTGSLFFGRRDIFKWVADSIHSAYQKSVLVLHGQRRMGKTSILLQLESGEMGELLRTRQDHPLVPIYIDLYTAIDPGTDKLLEYIIQEILKKLPETIRNGLAWAGFKKLRKSPYREFKQFMEQINQLIKPSILVLMMDEFEFIDEWVKNSKVDVSIYNLMRHHMQHLENVTYILAGNHTLNDLSEEYNKAFNIASHREVGFMHDSDARDLVTQPIQGQVFYEDIAVREIIRVTHGFPQLIQNLCNRIIQEMNAAEMSNYITLGNVKNTIDSYLSKEEIIIFKDMEKATSSNEKKILSLITRSLDENRDLINEADIRSVLNMNPEEMNAALSLLLNRRLIEKISSPENSKEPQYRPTILLFYKWWHRNYP